MNDKKQSFQTPETYIEVAKLRGGECLGPSKETPTVSSRKKYIWRCSEGHTWEARPDSVIQRGSWCRICNTNKQKESLTDIQAIASSHGGKLLSNEYENSKTDLLWECNEGHVFKANLIHVKRGQWCPICGKKKAGFSKRVTMKDIQALAKSHNGKCLSQSYDPSQKLEWQCHKGHTWKADYHNVKSGSWCPICGHMRSGRKKLTIEQMQEIAEKNEGKCLSETYTNSNNKLLWQCKEGHKWEALPLSVKKGSWCPICGGNTPLTLEQAQNLAIQRGGLCLSDHFIGTNKKLLWQCSEGHKWYATYGNVSFGRWCPECSSGVGERICRAYFEQLFDLPFPKIRPLWLINEDGFQMELDGYCEELSLAFEHQGSQHYNFKPYFYKDSKHAFEKRQQDDSFKHQLCQSHGITLIHVPQIPDLLHLPDVQTFILEECKKNGISIHPEVYKKSVKLLSAYSPSSREKMNLLHEITQDRGGEVLSHTYAGNNVKMKFRCENGHEWDTAPILILKGHWCPICSNKNRSIKRRLSIEDMQRLAGSKGGKCLSTEYINANTHLLWECSEGHQWKAIPNSIKRGSWCAICFKKSKKASK